MVSSRAPPKRKGNAPQTATAPTAKSKPSTKRRGQEDEDSDALDDEAVSTEEEEVVKPKKRAARMTASAARKKRKVSPSEDEDGEDLEVKAKGKAKNASKAKAKVYDSDDLDQDTEDEEDAKPKAKRRAKATTPRKKKAKKDEDEDGEFNDEDYDDAAELKEGQKVVGKVVQAPTTGRVPAGQMSNNTLKFLTHLKDPKCNDREWFRLHEPVYRVAEQEWKDFVEAFTDVLVEVDPQVPHLPTKDVIHRIYRDVRFSNDKTPYKRGFSATFSRGGRKGIFAKYHISVTPGNKSIIAAGVWCPGRNELANIRTNLQRDSRRLRRVISSPKFVEFFGKPERHPKGHRQNIFGHDDELRVAPKGIAKDHKDIDLLKCRSIAVVHTFTDSEVLEPDFKEKLGSVAKVMRPFVYVLNDLVTVGGGGDDDSQNEDEDAGARDEGDEAEVGNEEEEET